MEVMREIENLGVVKSEFEDRAVFYLEAIVKRELWNYEKAYRLTNLWYMVSVMACELDVVSEFVTEFNRRGKTQIRTAEQAIKAASFVVGEVMLENLGFRKQGLGYAFSYLYKYKIRD